jgi:hypothetical protein
MQKRSRRHPFLGLDNSRDLNQKIVDDLIARKSNVVDFFGEPTAIVTFIAPEMDEFVDADEDNGEDLVDYINSLEEEIADEMTNAMGISGWNGWGTSFEPEDLQWGFSIR